MVKLLPLMSCKFYHLYNQTNHIMQYVFKNLVFEGGGVKGIAYGGALKVLDELQLLDSIERVAGTSAGAINATLMALHVSTDEISKIIAQTDFRSFEDHSKFFPTNIYRVIKKFGWNKGDAFLDWIGHLIYQKAGTKDFTFGDLQEEIIGGNTKGFRFLYMGATNLTQQKRIVFSHEEEKYKKLPIREAVRMSMSIPLFFEAYPYQADYMVDGGVSYNYPINLFDKKEYLFKMENCKKIDNGDPSRIINYETLGFRLDSTEVISYAQRNWAIPPEKITGIKTYAGALLNFLMEMANKVHLNPDDWNRTIFIDTKDVKTTDFKLPQTKIDELIKSGEDCVHHYFEWRNADNKWNSIPS